MFDAIIQNAVVVLPAEVKILDVAVQNGKIAGLFLPGYERAAQRQYDLTGHILFPGAIDTHAHVTYCGSVAEGSRSAASGGVTTLLEMPTSGWMPNVMDRNIFQQRLVDIDKDAVVDFALWGGVSKDNIDKVMELDACGAVAYKAFTCDAGAYGCFDDSQLLALLRKVQAFDGLVGVHAEVQSICEACTNAIRAAGGGPERHSDSRPIIAEAIAVAKAAMLAQSSKARLHICHVSSPEVVQAVAPFRANGLRLTLETCPHYLLLTDEDVVRCGAYAKCSPPIRDGQQQSGLWHALIHGGIDVIGSDHANYSERQKEGGFWEAPGGFPGLCLFLSALYSEGVVKRHMPLTRLAQVTSANAAASFGLAHQKGKIALGLDADLAVIDPQLQWTYHASDFAFAKESAKYPYDGMRFTGKVVRTFVRGREMFVNGTFLFPNGGQLVKRGNKRVA